MGNTADLAGVAKLRVGPGGPRPTHFQPRPTQCEVSTFLNELYVLNNNNNKLIVSLQLHIFTLKYCYWKPAYAQYIAHIILLCPFVLAAEA